VVLNPAAVAITRGSRLNELFEAWELGSGERERLRHAGGACVMLYRAQGAVDPVKRVAPSSLGLAVFTLDMDLVMRRTSPVIEPIEAFHDLGVEDARCTRVGDRYLLYYTGHHSTKAGGTSTHICLATTRDFLEWDLFGPAKGDVNVGPNKNAALLPEAVDGKWLLLHRPMEGPDAMTVHLAEAADPRGPWHSRGKLMDSYCYLEFSRSWIGAGGPPISLGHGRFLMIYHQGHYTGKGAREYDLAAALLDFGKAQPVVGRIEPLMRPTGDREQQGDPDLGVDNVLFTCANYEWGADLVIPYAGADSRIFAAKIPVARLLAALEGDPHILQES
jgi:beta-1,2-mannobiose phosphorylase / 1,2-beta-oligomannan phosphorylase